MAQINKYQLKNGDTRYMFKLYTGINPATGKKSNTTRRGFKTQKEATLALSRLELEINDKGSLPKENNILFSDVYEEWHDQHINRVEESTDDKIVSLFKNHVLPAFGNLRVRAITSHKCQTVLNEWFKEVTLNYKRWFIYTKKVLNFAVKQGYIQQNPASLVTMPLKRADTGDKPENFWDKEELTAFFKCLDKKKQPEQFTWFRLLAFTGLRKGEALALTWEDIDFNNSTLRVNKNLGKGYHGHLYLKAPKTRASRRTIELDPITLSTLKKWRMEQRELYLMHGINTLHDKQLLFATNKNTFLSENTPRMWLVRVIEANNLKPITTHGFRHTHCSALFSAGATLKEVQVRLGHSDIQTTMNVYAHVTKDQNVEAVSKLASYLDF
ncbi:site-specific integrase [Pediococcus ethanolidurans]|uniref:site-specific integrase n=1 Tax=Pediococcus ethanolidurans TaxID=319653 RepID=UPI0021E84B80|nr:site-specific integrase [Pediococcus ethanolidurans]MCV3322701.1 site-specific integrase [Pediococcus ethanolidurans]